MFSRKTKEPSRVANGIEYLQQIVEQHLPDADQATRDLVLAIAGLLACVIYADREFTQAERERVREVLGTVDGLSVAGVESICTALATHLRDIALSSPQRHTRVLCELAEPELRREVLEVLVDLAAADGDLSMAEADLLRRTTTALGLSQDDYIAAQARHLQQLSVLK